MTFEEPESIVKIFHCDYCGQHVFFENVRCVSCEHALAFLTGPMTLAALSEGADGLWRRPGDDTAYKLCQNYANEKVCNWALPADDPNVLCLSCRVTRVIPDLNVAGNRLAWYKLEVAKRRLIYTLMALGLPLSSKTHDPRGVAFEFLADCASGDGPRVLTGHADGLITLNIAEADDVERERRRLALHEPYRTLLGHFRHEIGHYYWDCLIADGPWLKPFREMFGDERADYSAALRRHYDQGPPADWQNRFISAYSTSHPWEDWAETWAHYLHMKDALETAAECGLSLRPKKSNELQLTLSAPVLAAGRLGAFDAMIESWYPLTYVLNNLNRGLGLPDGYPFVLSPGVIGKLAFVHGVIAAQT